MNNEIKNIDVSNKIKSKTNRPITCKINPNLINTYNQLENNPQSPKINNKEFRSNSQPKLFSLIDIKDRYHSKTTSVPNQYKRIIYKNINKLLYSKNSNIFKIPQIDYDLIKNNLKNKTIMVVDKNEKGKKLRKSKSQENIYAKDYRIQSAVMSRKERLYKPKCFENLEMNKNRDKYMPEGFEIYKKNLKGFNKNYLENNYVKKDNKNIDTGNEYVLIRKLNKFKHYQSDIFFTKEKEIDKEENKNENNFKNNIIKFTESDIFNLKKTEGIIKKSGEHSYFKNSNKENNTNKTISYNMNNETLLGWKLRSPLPSLYNHTSTKYHLLNRNIKNIGNTKQEVLNECKKTSENFNPSHKQKSLCEFIDLCRVTAPKINNDYNKALTENPNVFKKTNEISSEYFDIYNHYNSICDKPFQKFNPINNIFSS